jgi:hypothetical protein
MQSEYYNTHILDVFSAGSLWLTIRLFNQWFPKYQNAYFVYGIIAVFGKM